MIFSARVTLNSEAAAKIDAEKDATHQIVVVEQLVEPHPLVERTLKSMMGAAADDRGIVRPRAKQCLNVAVSKATCLNPFVAALIKVAEHEKADRIKAEQQKRYWEEQDRLRKEESRRAGEEKARREDLDTRASAWRKSQRLREYILAVEDAAKEKFDQIDPESKLGKWLAWAKLRAEKIDPIRAALDQLTQERTDVEGHVDLDDDDD